MARQTPVPKEKIEEGQRIRELRESLHITRTAFAALTGFSYQLLEAKEVGRVPFRREELSRIKNAVEKHIMAGFAALRALPF